MEEVQSQVRSSSLLAPEAFAIGRDNRLLSTFLYNMPDYRPCTYAWVHLLLLVGMLIAYPAPYPEPGYLSNELAGPPVRKAGLFSHCRKSVPLTAPTLGR